MTRQHPKKYSPQLLWDLFILFFVVTITPKISHVLLHRKCISSGTQAEKQPDQPARTPVEPFSNRTKHDESEVVVNNHSLLGF